MTTIGPRQVEGLEEGHPLNKQIIVLHPVVERIPNSYNIYSPSKVRLKKEINYNEFLSKYAEHAIGILVCFDESPSLDDLLQNSKLITAYNFGLDCWYIIDADYENNLTISSFIGS